jgi:hypothetical protein
MSVSVKNALPDPRTGVKDQSEVRSGGHHLNQLKERYEGRAIFLS